jgi:hypothetical protein
MAIDPLQRHMFRIPGVNPRNVAGGIYNLSNMGNAATASRPVAAQPLQVANLPTNRRVPLITRVAPTNVAAKPLGFTPEAVSGKLPETLERWEGRFTKETDDELRNLWESTNKQLETLQYENVAKKEDKPQQQVENRADLLAFRSALATEAGNRGITLPGLGDDDFDPDVKIDSNVNAIVSSLKPAEKATLSQTGGASSADADAAKKKAIKDAKALLNAGTGNKSDFKELLKALGGDAITDYGKWKTEAKSLLGIDEDEKDVPDWAAPMFLFGLNLMKGPVSSKTEGQTGLGGLLSDIGAAGEKGFAFFATERERKRKERASVATIAMQLQTADTARKKLLIDAYKADSATKLNLTKAVNSAYNNSINRVLSIVPSGQEEKKVRGIAAYNSAWSNFQSAGVRDDQLLNPKAQMLLESHAANEMGIIKTPIKLDNIKIGGIDTYFSRNDLEAARAEYNKNHPSTPIKSMTEFLTKIITKNSEVANYQSLVIGERADKTTDTTFSYVNKDNEKVTEVRVINEAARDQWFADNPAPAATASQAEKAAYAEKVKAATPTWQFITETRLTDQPNYVERSFVNKDGVKTKFYINEAAFDARRRSSPAENKLTLQEVLLNPDKYPKILGGKIKDFSNLQPNLENILVYDKGLKRTFVIDKNAAGRALAEGKIKAGAGQKQLIELGLGRFIGEGVPVKPNEKIQVMKVVNGVPTLTMIEAGDAAGVMAAFSSKQDAKDWKQRENALVTLNTTLWEIDKVLTDRGLGVTSGLTDLAGSAVTLAKIGKSVFNQALGNRNRVALNSNVSSDVRSQLNKAFGESVWTKIIQDKEQRGAVKSMFINLAFALASSREGGKLTDNDVKNALETLGWDGTAWTLTPGQALARMKVAARTANDSYINDALGRLSTSKEKEAYIKSQNENKPDFVEQLLRERAQVIKGVLQDRFRANPDIDLRYDRKADPAASEGDGRRPLLAVEQSFKFGIPANKRGVFSSQVDNLRMPNTLRIIHNEVLFPGGEYSPVESVRDLTTRIRSQETAQRLKALGLTEDKVTELVNQYLKYYNENSGLFVSPQ